MLSKLYINCRKKRKEKAQIMMNEEIGHKGEKDCGHPDQIPAKEKPEVNYSSLISLVYEFSIQMFRVIYPGFFLSFFFF